jgi:hypothetical protein
LINVQRYPQYLLRGVQKVFPTDVGIGTCLLGIKLVFAMFEPQRYCGFPIFEIFKSNQMPWRRPHWESYQLLDQSFTNQSRVDLKKHFICLSIHFPSFICLLVYSSLILKLCLLFRSTLCPFTMHERTVGEAISRLNFYQYSTTVFT